MSKTSKSRKHSEKMKRKKSAKAAKKAKYEGLAGTGKRRAKRAKKSKLAGIYKGAHIMVDCGNVGCKRCNPRTAALRRAKAVSLALASLRESEQVKDAS